MYSAEDQHVQMIEVTATNLRKDLFRILDRLAETGEELRVRRKGQVITFTPVRSGAGMSHREKFDAALASGVREDWADYDPGDITDNRHIEWTPEDN